MVWRWWQLWMRQLFCLELVESEWGVILLFPVEDLLWYSTLEWNIWRIKGPNCRAVGASLHSFKPMAICSLSETHSFILNSMNNSLALWALSVWGLVDSYVAFYQTVISLLAKTLEWGQMANLVKLLWKAVDCWQVSALASLNYHSFIWFVLQGIY
jgi:hypothetical protein